MRDDSPYDEALHPEVLHALAETDLDDLTARLDREIERAGVEFGGDGGQEPFRLDPVPRVFRADEWASVEAGLLQRVRALECFVADAYGGRAIVAAGRMPERALASCDHLEPLMAELPPPPLWIGVAGLDVVRLPSGELRVLEDNLRTPSGVGYAVAARELMERVLPGGLLDLPLPLAGAFAPLGETLLACAPDGNPEPSVVLLSDGPRNSAWYEHHRIARELAIPLVTLRDLAPGERLGAVVDGRRLTVDVVYRRTDEDRLTDERGSLTAVGSALFPSLQAGTLVCANGFGAGVADDKLVHAYVEEMIRFYLDEEPLLRSVRTYDLADEGSRTAVLERLDELVVKPRAGYGGEGVMVGPHARPEDRQRVADAIRRSPGDYVAQETVMLSRHATVIDGELAQRHVDLRPFVFLTPDGGRVFPGGLTRVAFEEDALVVNSSQRSGAKDTWVLPGS